MTKNGSTPFSRRVNSDLPAGMTAIMAGLLIGFAGCEQEPRDVGHVTRQMDAPPPMDLSDSTQRGDSPESPQPPPPDPANPDGDVQETRFFELPLDADLQAGDAPRKSALDEAVDSIREKEEVEPWREPPVEPAEPHAELIPLIEDHWVRLHPGYEVWLDAREQQVIVGGRVCFRNGPLEMFACPMNTKEHESIISTISNAEIVHTALLAAGAVPGKPMQWEPEYVPPSGPEIQITVVWSDAGKRTGIDARQMVLDIVKEAPLEHNWVFCGSGEWIDSQNPGHREYWADGGDMICVTNFSDAMMDLRVESSNLQEGLRYHANTENIPELGKPVLLVLKPDLKRQ